MRKVVFILIAGLLVCVGCAQRSRDMEMSQLQMREIQSRVFSSQDSKVVLKEMMNVMQDDQFIIKNASFELGMLTGEKSVDISETFEKTIKILFLGAEAHWSNHCVIEISVNISQLGEDARARVNFQKKIFNNKGHVIKIEPIYDQKYYQEFFNKVHNGLFIQEQQI